MIHRLHWQIIWQAAIIVALYCATGKGVASKRECDAHQYFKHCKFGNNTKELTNSLSVSANNNESNITIVTYFTNSIQSYAAYAAYVNYVWASYRNNYSFRVINETFAKQHNLIEPKDERWNKIKILEYMLINDAKHSEFVVWIDADLIIMNMNSFDLELDIINNRKRNNNEESKLIMSRDMITAPFISNTGFIICKNEQWTIDFLQSWWNIFDRSKCCDQHAFNWLYHHTYEELNEMGMQGRSLHGIVDRVYLSQLDIQLQKDIKLYITILPANILNTDFPAYRNQLPSDSVLHLIYLQM